MSMIGFADTPHPGRYAITLVLDPTEADHLAVEYGSKIMINLDEMMGPALAERGIRDIPISQFILVVGVQDPSDALLDQLADGTITEDTVITGFDHG